MQFIENKFKNCTNDRFFFHDHFHDFSQIFNIFMTFYKSDLFFRFFRFFMAHVNPVVAKVIVDWFSKDALTLLYLSPKKKKKEEEKVVAKYRASTKQQGSRDGPLVFNILIKKIALFIQYMALGNYAKDNNLYITGSTIKDLKYHHFQTL